MLLFSIKHYSCLTNCVKLFFQFTNTIEVFHCNVLLFLRPRSYESHNICSCSLPPSPCMLLHTETQILKLSGAEPEKVELGHISQFLFLSLCQCPSSAHLCYWRPSWCSPHPPSESPHSSGDPSVVFPLLLYHSGSLCHISTLIFLFFVSKPKLMSKLYQHIRIFRRVFYISRSRKSQGHNIVYMSEAAKWPPMSKQESNCWAWSHQPEEAPAKSKTRSPISPLCLGLQWPVPQT